METLAVIALGLVVFGCAGIAAQFASKHTDYIMQCRQEQKMRELRKRGLRARAGLY